MKNYIIPVRTLNTTEQLSSLATIILMLKLTPTLKFKLYCTKWKILFKFTFSSDLITQIKRHILH